MLGQIFILVLLILLNAFFAASEIAYISLNDAKIEKKAKEGDKKAKQIEKMLKTPSKFLATIQIGITLAGFLSSAFASDTFADMLAPIFHSWIPAISLGAWKGISIVIITIILSFFTLIFGELVPKRIGMKNSEKVAYFSIGIIRAISIIAAPFVRLLTIVTNGISKLFGIGENEEETVTEEEIKMMLDQGREKGTIEDGEKELINNVFEFNDITASEIMTHRKDIFAVDKNIKLQELLEEISDEEYRYSRIPVYDETIDEIQGVLYVKDILKNMNKKNFKVKNIMKEAYYVPQNKVIDEVFKEMKKKKVQMAIVLDEYGGTAGLITMEDIIEELVGDIYDEYDEVEEEYVKIDEDTYILSGSMTIYDVNKLLNAKIPEGDYDTLSGFLQEELGRIPDSEEMPTIETEEVTYKIEEYEDRRILKVKACKNHPKETEGELKEKEE